MDIIPVSVAGQNLDARGAVLSRNGRLLVDSSGAYGGINVRAIQTGVNLGSTVYADNGMLMVEAVAIDFVHWKVHAGDYYVASATNTGVANNATINIQISPSGETMHTIFAIASEGKARYSLIENPTGIIGGVAISGINANRTSSNLTIASIKTGVTYDGGTPLLNSSLFGGTGPQSIGAGEAGRHEWMLKTGNHYILSVRNVAGSSKDMDFIIEWYEAGPDYHGAGWS